MDWKIEKISPVVARLRINGRRHPSWQFRILLTADRHIDGDGSNKTVIRQHMAEALAGGWPNLDFGDTFDAMQGREDRRRDNNRKKKGPYFDGLVSQGEEFFRPYAESMALLGLGNHETAVMKHVETNLIDRLARRLAATGSPVVTGGYSGWVKITIVDSTYYQTLNLFYTHGGGSGSAPVTKGVIKTNRRAVYLPDANIVVSGHTHEQWFMPITRRRISDAGVEFIDEQIHIQVPSYKNALLGRTHGFEVELDGAPKPPPGAYWLKIFWSPTQKKFITDVSRAMM